MSLDVSTDGNGGQALSSAGRIAVVGARGVVGARVAKRLAGTARRTVVELDTRVESIASNPFLDEVSHAVLATPGPHLADAVALLDRGITVISVGDQVDDVDALIAHAHRAERRDASLVVGAGMSPGLVALLARHLSTLVASVDEIHVAIHGTAGPACARQHHRALAGEAVRIDDGQLILSRAGTGRELAWFPEPVGAYDCYRAESPVPSLLHRAFPEASRISARLSANRRDRLTSRLPMLTPPHSEGGVGALRVEVRGEGADGGRVSVIAGIAEMVGTATAATVAAFVEASLAGALPSGLVVPGDPALDTVSMLRTVERCGVRLQEFTGVPNG
jgi:hypothetical protein